MKKLICLLLAALSASAATITGPVGDISGNPYSPRIEFWPLSTPFSSGTTNIVGPKKEKQVVNGNFSIDLLPGRYLVKFPPTTNYFTIVVPTNGSSYALSEVATNLPAMAGIAQTAWILENSGVGTNTTFYGTITMPASGVNGYVWTATNNTGAGFWAAGVSAASVAAKANTNTPTLYSPTNIAMAAFAPTNSSIEPVVLVVPNDVNQSFYFGTVFPGTIGEGTISIGNRNDADGHSSFVAGNANITYAHNSTVVGNANDVGNALNGEKNVVFGHGNSISQNNTNVVVVGVANAVLVDGKTNIINFGYGNAVTETLAGAIGFNLDNSTLGTIDIGLDNSTKASIGQTVARFRTPISSSGMTNSGTTDALIYADANGKYGEATAANVYGLWTGTGTYMTRFGTNANVSGGSGETNLQRVLQVGSDAAGQNATNFNNISATNATFENFNVENQYTTNHYVTSLTSGRVVLATTGGQLTDHSGFTYNTGTGNLSVQGSVTAESFAGDGSLLTDLNATEISSGMVSPARLGYEYLSNGHTASVTFSNASTTLRGTLQVAGAAVFTNNITTQGQFIGNGQGITNIIYAPITVTMFGTNAAIPTNCVSFLTVTNHVRFTNWASVAVAGQWFNVFLTNSTGNNYYIDVPTNGFTRNMTNSTGSYVVADASGTNFACLLTNGQRARLVGEFVGGNLNAATFYFRHW